MCALFACVLRLAPGCLGFGPSQMGRASIALMRGCKQRAKHSVFWRYPEFYLLPLYTLRLQLLYGQNAYYWLEPPSLISHLKPLTAHFRSNQPWAKIRSADIYYVAKRLILHRECGDVSENPVMPVRLLQIWIDFHFTARPSPSVESPPPCLSTQMTMRRPR